MSRPRKRVPQGQSPARFLSIYADVGDSQYVDGSSGRRAIAHVWQRLSRGEVVAPPQPTRDGDTNLDRSDYQPSGLPSKPR